MRKSKKYSKKWQECFCSIDIHSFTSESCEKIFYAYNCRQQIYKEEIMTLRDLKRVRLDSDVQMLCLPRYLNKQVNVLVEGS